MFSALAAMIRKELLQTFRDKRMVALMTVVPLIQLVAFGYAVSLDVKDVPVVVADEDRTPESRRFVKGLLAGDTLKFHGEVPSGKQAARYLIKGHASVALVIPKGFGRRIKKGRRASVQVLVDGGQSTVAVVAGNAAALYAMLKGGLVALEHAERYLKGVLASARDAGDTSVSARGGRSAGLLSFGIESSGLESGTTTSAFSGFSAPSGSGVPVSGSMSSSALGMAGAMRLGLPVGGLTTGPRIPTPTLRPPGAGSTRSAGTLRSAAGTSGFVPLSTSLGSGTGTGTGTGAGIGTITSAGRLDLSSAANLAPGGDSAPQIAPAPPAGLVELLPRVLYNPTLESRIFMVPGVAASLLLIVTTIVTAVGIAREREMGTLEQIMVTPISPATLVLGKTLPYAVIAAVDLMLVIAVGAWLFDVPIRGSLFLISVAGALYLLTTLGVGLFISTVSGSQQQAIMGGFFFIMPAILLSGFIAPVENMPEWLQPLTVLDPVRHFVEILRACLLKGASWGDLAPQFAALTCFGIVIFAVAALRFRKQLG